MAVFFQRFTGADESFARKCAGSLWRAGALAAPLTLAIVAGAAEVGEGISDAPLAPRAGPRGATLFVELAAADTGVVTENRYDDPDMWGKRHHEFEVGAMGTGVAIGDYDGDGRPDLFVVSKTETCRLFRNLGGWKFEDVTAEAGVADDGAAARVWKQGATFVDVNNDGRLDLYVCRFDAPNLLYVNRADGAFVEEAVARGLAMKDASAMAAFGDYDRDGWLDVLVLTNILDSVAQPRGRRSHLFHNRGNGAFEDVTDRAGIRGEGQGHSATWWDHDDDGWPDLYIANDFAAPDQLYRNNHDGTFTEVINRVAPHLPYSSMGADLGDVDNDGLIDLVVAEMAATTHEKDQRTMAASRSLLAEDPAENSAAVPQMFRNALFLNTGAGRPLEAAFLAGLAATDWTWSVRFEDLDNDGRLDLHVTNGMHRESHNVDLLLRTMTAATPAEKIRITRASPMLAEQNLAFRNRGELRFEDVSETWGLNQTGVSFGAAFGDLDGDGDLDLVYSNFQKGVALLRNDSDRGHSVIFALRGAQTNRFGVGATVRIETPSGAQVRQLVLARGYSSSSEPILHFGLGDETRIERATVTWPSGRNQSFTNLAADRKYTIAEAAAPELAAAPAEATRADAGMFTEVSESAALALASHEAKIDEVGQNPLLPLRQNRRGPALAVGDLNGDAIDDLVVGGTSAGRAQALLADGAGRFTPGVVRLPSRASALNDGPVLVFDANGDDANDVLVTKSGVALPPGAAEYQPQLFFNDGQGGFAAAPAGALPPLALSAGAAAAADFDRDGDLDVFLGARVLPGMYPFAPRSALLANQGGKFENVISALAPQLREIGMVTSALWSDVDDDGWLDLLVAVDWGRITYFHNDHGKSLADWTERAGFAAAGTGWWSSLAAGDFNGDGHIDYVAGNLGLNTQYRADARHPALLFAGDFNGDDTTQLVEAYYEGDTLYPWRTRRDLGAAIPAILKKFARNDAYARATLGEILGEEKLAAAERFAATELRSGVFLSQAEGTFRFEPLPRIAQISPFQGIAAGDFDGDGHADVYAVQNSYAPIPAIGRFDGGLSQLLLGDGRGGFTALPVRRSRLIVPGDAKALVALDLERDGWPDFVVSRNNNTILAFRNNGVGGRHSLRVELRGPPGNRAAIGARVAVRSADGGTQTSEVYAGSGYFSQTSAANFFGGLDANPPRTVRVRWPSGAITETDVPPGSHTIAVSSDGQ